MACWRRGARCWVTGDRRAGSSNLLVQVVSISIQHLDDLLIRCQHFMSSLMFMLTHSHSHVDRRWSWRTLPFNVQLLMMDDRTGGVHGRVLKPTVNRQSRDPSSFICRRRFSTYTVHHVHDHDSSGFWEGGGGKRPDPGQVQHLIAHRSYLIKLIKTGQAPFWSRSQ